MLLLALAGGQCEMEGCPEFIYQDILTKQRFNFGQYAHIIGDSPDGPRGDKTLSEDYCSDINNIMLLCPKHHKMIDTLVKKYSVETLRRMKKHHEDRVHRLLSIGKGNSSTVLLYAANVGLQNSLISADEAYETVMHYNKYPSDDTPIEIGLVNSAIKDYKPSFWDVEHENLEANFEKLVASRIAKHDIKNLSVFAIAPMPLLVNLGVLLSDKFGLDVYQLHKIPRSWEWQEDNVQRYKIVYPEDKSGKPVMLFSLSAANRGRIERFYKGKHVSIWQMTIPEPNNDYLRSQAQLEEFKRLTRAMFEDINQTAPTDESIDVHMAMSVSCAVALGMVRNGKADRKMKLFDYNKGKDKYAFTI